LAASVASINAHAEEPGPFNKRLLPVELVMSFRNEIDLSAAQNDQIGKLVVQVQQSVAEKQWQMQSDYFALVKALDQTKIDEDVAIKLAKSAVDAENAIKIEQIRLLIRLRNLLTTDQVEFLRKRLDEGWSDT
jgi:Spy/CpxP family protein refolding chaperone